MAQMADFGFDALGCQKHRHPQQRHRTFSATKEVRRLQDSGNVAQLEQLLQSMSQAARQQAEAGIHLSSKLDGLRLEQAHQLA
jgi:hypothetical protein